MGCCSSNYAAARANLNMDDTYVASPQRSSSKRNYSSRLSSGSSGIFSRCNTPSRRSIWSRSSTASARTCTPKPKTSNLNLHSQSQEDMPKAVEIYSICDDFCEAPQVAPEQQQPCNLDNSYGYFSESMSTSTSGNNKSNSSKPNLVRTVDTSDTRTDSPLSMSFRNELEMEMYMMTHSRSCMFKTSSPFCNRRNVTIEMPLAAASPASASYEKWRNYLQHTPPYMLHNVTDIPEAMAGHFSPLHFPGYTDLDDMESAPKRYKVDLEAACDTYTATAQTPASAMELTHTISTDL